MERGKLVKVSFVPEAIGTLKRDMDRAHDNDSLPGATRAGIGHIRNDFYDRFYGIELDLSGRVPNAAYMAEGVLLAEIVDPHTKTLQLLSDEDKERTKAALDRRMEDQQEELRAAATGAPTGLNRQGSSRTLQAEMQRIRKRREAETSAAPRSPGQAACRLRGHCGGTCPCFPR